MIGSLRKKFIFVSAASILLVVAGIFPCLPCPRSRSWNARWTP